MEFSWQLKYPFRISEAAATLESLRNSLVIPCFLVLGKAKQIFHFYGSEYLVSIKAAIYLLLTSNFLLFFTLQFPFPSRKKKFLRSTPKSQF